MSNRLIKQFIYGSGYLAVLFIFLSVIYFIFIKSGATCFDGKQNGDETGVDCGGYCASCEIRTLLPIQVNNIKYFSAGNKSVIVSEIANTNLNYGVSKFSYVFDIYDKNGERIKSETDNSFIYPSEVKYLINVADVSPSEIGDIKLSFSNINWKQKDGFKKPNVQIRQKITKAGEDGKGAEISGMVSNDNPFVLSKVRLVGFLATQSGIRISASKTELENLQPYEEKYFKIVFPKDVSLMSATSSFINLTDVDPSQTEVYVEAIR